MSKGETFVELLEGFMDTRDEINRQRREIGYSSEYHTSKLNQISRDIAEIVDSVFFSIHLLGKEE